MSAEVEGGSHPACSMKALGDGVFFLEFPGEGEGLVLLLREVGGARSSGGECAAAVRGRCRRGFRRVAGTGAVPFEEGEFGVVPAAAFQAAAEAGPPSWKRFPRRRREAFHGELGGGAQSAGAGGGGVDVGFRRIMTGGWGAHLEDPRSREEAAMASFRRARRPRTRRNSPRAPESAGAFTPEV